MNDILVKTEHKFALHAPDCTLHMESFSDDQNFSPKKLQNEVGAGGDFFTDLKFIDEVIDRFPLESGEKINWLDLGCAGGKLILDISNHEKTDICIGLDGSVGVYKQESWSSGKNKDVLKNADLSKEFFIEKSNGDKVIFDVITAWELVEHFYENELEVFFTNVYNHLSDDGVFIGSAANYPDVRDENGYSPCDSEFNENGKLYDLHKIFWDRNQWDKFLSKWFNIQYFDFENKFRDMNEGLTYYFMATKRK
jgi:cyclopropane fatty-acyl-phospholipid synthase-like methyltransferase